MKGGNFESWVWCHAKNKIQFLKKVFFSGPALAAKDLCTATNPAIAFTFTFEIIFSVYTFSRNKYMFSFTRFFRSSFGCRIQSLEHWHLIEMTRKIKRCLRYRDRERHSYSRPFFLTFPYEPSALFLSWAAVVFLMNFKGGFES